MKRKLLTILISTLLLTGCANMKSILIHANDYEVVDDAKINLEAKNRTARLFLIVSDAQTADELAQTGMLAAYELHKKYGYDLTTVLLYPDKHLIKTGAYYAHIDYAADNKGARGLSGVDKTLFTSGKWKVTSAEKALSVQELYILQLWYENQKSFPSKDIYSSSSFDQASLIAHIAKELEIDIAEVELPSISRKDYKGVKIENWMTPEPNN